MRHLALVALLASGSASLAGGADPEPLEIPRASGWCRLPARPDRIPARLNLPAWVCDAADRSRIDTRFDVDTRINPFFMTADFDGDGLTDAAVWVRSRRSKKVGLAMFRRARGAPVVLGAGREWEERGDDFAFVDLWTLVPKSTVLDSPWEEHRKVRLAHDAIELVKSESAAFVIDWAHGSYRAYQVSD